MDIHASSSPLLQNVLTITHEQARLLRRPLVLLQGLVVSPSPQKIVCSGSKKQGVPDLPNTRFAYNC